MRSDDDHTVDASNAALIMDRAGSERKELVRLTNSYHVATLDYDADVDQRADAGVRQSQPRRLKYSQSIPADPPISSSAYR